MGCGDCHSKQAGDILLLRRADVVPAAMPGHVDRKRCLGRHAAPAEPAWYGLGR